MVQSGGELDLPQEALGSDRHRELGAECLHGYPPLVAEIVREIHDRHPAPSYLPLDAVAVR